MIIPQELASVLAEVFGIRPSVVTLELCRDSVSNWDSLKQMDLIVTLESEYNVTFDIDEIVKMTSVAEILRILKAKGVKLEN